MAHLEEETDNHSLPEIEEDFLGSFADVPVISSEKREMCDRCKRPRSVCLCAHFPSKYLQVSTTIHVLQHPREESRLLTTVPLLQMCLPPEKLLIRRGRRFYKTDWPDLHEKVAKPSTVLLYPGPKAENIKMLKPLPPGEHYDIIILDGTWRQSKDLFNNNPFLHNARQVQLEHNNISEYVIRTQPTSKSLCTIEAIALSLAVLENNEEICEILMRPLRALCKIQLNHGALVHFNKEHEDEIFLRAQKEEKRKLKHESSEIEKERTEEQVT